MKRLNPEKLTVTYKKGVTETEPLLWRHYTLTHSDITGELFLTIGLNFAYEEINKTRDEVLARWYKINNHYILYLYVYIDGKFNPMTSFIRNRIFVRELPLALEAIRYGDREFFKSHPHLDKAPIYIYFDSSNPNLNRVEFWGTPSDYA